MSLMSTDAKILNEIVSGNQQWIKIAIFYDQTGFICRMQGCLNSRILINLNMNMLKKRSISEYTEKVFKIQHLVVIFKNS